MPKDPIRHILIIHHLPSDNRWNSKLLTHDELAKLKLSLESKDSKGMEIPMNNAWDLSIPMSILINCVFMQKMFDLREISDDDFVDQKFIGIEGTIRGLEPMENG